ncbi:Proteophosphoglycan 5, related, related [Eimeria brunetti]|uniref:Proteophosphoglycan 5, related, related n=1 Tax=Eimeria brunetti TaxID=51314 RepID=U6LGP0_9EIME|nr:Proteophosphoglycan 5, related, related [Eimeria brunetti]
MEPCTETSIFDYKSGSSAATATPSVTGRSVTDEPRSKSIALDHVRVEVDKYNGEATDAEKNPEAEGPVDTSSGCSDILLEELDGNDGPLKAVHDLEEALWLVQEELAEEQRLRTEERKHYAAFQDEYLRLQEESAINSKRITAAEVSAQAARSLASDAVEDKEYFARLLYHTQTQLQNLTALVQDVMPRFKAKLSHLIEQGNTIVALLATRWPEARLRKQIEALGMSDQPLARWALLHALKTKEIQLCSANQRGSDVCASCPSSSRELGRTKSLMGSTISKSQLKTGEATLRSVEDTVETIQRKQRTSDQLDGVDGKGGRGRLSKQRAGAESEAAFCLPLHLRHQAEALPSSRMSLPNSSALDKRMDSRGHVEGSSIAKDGSKLVSRPSSVAMRSRVQTTADRKIKLPNSTMQPSPSSTRHPLPPLPLGKIVLQGATQLASRESHRANRSQAAFTKNSEREKMTSCKEGISMAAPPVSSRKCSSKQKRQFKEDHGLKPCGAQDNTPKPASSTSPSKRHVAQRGLSLDPEGPPMHMRTAGNLRATQPQPLVGFLPSGDLPSRMTCGAVLPPSKEPSRRQSVCVNETKERKRDSVLFQDLTALSSKEASMASQVQSAAGIKNGIQSQNMASLPSSPVTHQPAVAHDGNRGSKSDCCAATEAPVAAVGRIEGVEDVSGSCSTAQRTDARLLVGPQPLKSSGTRAVRITVQGPSGGKPNNHTDKANAASIPKEHSVEAGQKAAFPTCNVANWGLNITPHLQEATRKSCQAVVSLNPQNDASKGSPATAAPARLIQSEQHGNMHHPHLPSSTAPRIQEPPLDLSRPKKGDGVRDVCTAQHFVPCGVARGTIPLQPQQFQVSASQQPERERQPGIRYEVPRRSSLPDSSAKGLQAYGSNMHMQHQQLIMGHDGRAGMPWPTRTMGQPPVFGAGNPCSYGFQPLASFQQHPVSIPQQYLRRQSQQFQMVIPNQQQGAVANMHYIVRGVGSDFIARQRQHTSIPMPGGWRNR